MSAALVGTPWRRRVTTAVTCLVTGLIVTGGLGAGLAQAATTAPGKTSGSFTVATYNVAGLPEGVSSGHPAANTPEMGRRLLAFDMVNVQEDFSYHAKLYATATFPYRSKTSGDALIGSGLNTMSRLPFTSLQRVTWNRCNGTDCLTPKGFTYKQVQLAPGAFVDVYNLHTNAGTEPGDLAARKSNLAQLAAYVTAHSVDHAVIIAGDTNARYTRAEDTIASFAKATGTTDAWIQQERGGRLPASDPNPTLCQPGKETNSCEIVDKIFYRSGSTVKLDLAKYTNEDLAFLDAAGVPLSDHRPVSAAFRWQLAG